MNDRTATSPLADDDRLGPDVWRVAIAVIVGAFMSIIDMTIVNVALEQLGRDLGADGFDDVQWVMTAYMLAVAAVIPITGWASERIGGRRLFLLSLVTFTVASALCAASWNLWSLVAFRVLQGLAGGALMPAGQMLLARAAGPHRMGRVMSVVGVPILLAPVLGPVLGGLILDSLAWEWIFLVNVPVGIAGYVLAARLLPHDPPVPEQHRRLDWVGLVLASTGLPLIVYGLANAAGHGTTAPVTWLPALVGIALVVTFVRHALRTAQPLVDVLLFRSRSFTYAAITTFLLGACLFGSIVLMPLYYQVARGEDVLTTGLLLAPQGIGAALGMFVSGRFTDRIGGGIVTIIGLLIMIVGTLPFVFLDGSSSYLFLSVAMVVRGIGFGSSMMPSMAAAFATLRRDQIGHATPQLNVLQRVGGSVGTALLATILQAKLTDATAAFSGGGGARIGEGGADGGLQQLPPQVADAAGTAFGDTFIWVLAATAVTIIPAALLAREEHKVRRRRAIDADRLDADALAAAATGEPVDQA